MGVSAQAVSKNDMLKIIAAADSFRNKHPIEKLYLQFDKPYYAVGDTIWFKAYLITATYPEPRDKSGLFYVELANDSNKVVTRMMLPLANGLSWGNITIDKKNIPEGIYTLRAYTNRMRNFGDDYIFKKNFYIEGASESAWLVNPKINLIKDNGTEKAHLSLQFNKLNNEPVRLQDMELQVFDGKKLWYKSPLQTKTDGSLDLDFTLKTRAKQVTILAKNIDKGDENHKVVIPISFNRPESMDLQFMPEGGNLVAGLPAFVAFKAIGENGKATAVQGEIVDSHQQPVASFKSVRKGMGAFDLIPQAGETYTAKVILQGGVEKNYSLPHVKTAGTVLKIREIKGSDSLAVTVTSTQENGSYYLVGQSRGIICYAAVINLLNNAVKAKISATNFPTGIARFTVLNAEKQPLNERIVFINHYDNLQIALNTDKPIYKSRDSIALQVQVNDIFGRPVRGSFSLAVTDDTQVKTDSTGSGNMISNLLLTSDLKGDVDEPGYYFQPDPDGSIKQQLDNLLLTQGWTGYDWPAIFTPPKQLQYPAEQEFAIKGKVVNVFNKPVVNTHVIVFSKKPTFVLDTITDKGGHFIFRHIVPLDTPAYLVQARNRNGKSFNVSVDVDEFKPPVFMASAENKLPWYVNTDTALINHAKNNIAAEKEQLTGSGHVLKEVIISAKKIIKDSQNLNGPGNADQVIDEQELEKAGKKTFLQLLQEKIPGFREGFFQLSGSPDFQKVREDRIFAAFIVDDIDAATKGNIDQFWYFINGKPVKFIIDGIPLYKIMTMTLPAITNINDYLNSHSAEDIKGIEVNSSTTYAMRYVPIEWARLVAPSDIAFVEITTRSGNGPGISNTPGTYLYKPLPFSLPKQFYSPRYPVKNKDTIKDYRSTIFWAPNVLTDKDGKATVSFYAADKKGTYTVIFEGTDGNGTIGSAKSKINIKGK